MILKCAILPTLIICLVIVMSLILFNIAILSLIAIIAAVVLYFTAKKFAVENNPIIDEIASILPQANCGACGSAGCQNFASRCAAASEQEFANLYCPVGGAKVMTKIAQLLGYKAEEKERTCAVLHCNGTCQNAPDKVQYIGLKSCRLASRVFVGRTGCPDGCLRMGDCVRNCPFNAIELDEKTGLPKVDPDKCTSCGACVRICPRGLFEIRPVGKDGVRVYVACNNKQKGAIARKNCSAACIGCMKCAKICADVKVENNLSHIPTTVSAEEYGEQLAANCPTGAIIYTGKKNEQN